MRNVLKSKHVPIIIMNCECLWESIVLGHPCELLWEGAAARSIPFILCTGLHDGIALLRKHSNFLCASEHNVMQEL